MILFVRSHRLPTHQQTAYAPADGEGRNGAYLAAQGYQVTSTDIADLAVARHRRSQPSIGWR